MKVIAVDLDGTLLDSDGKLHDDMRELITVIRSKGILFGVATGRPGFAAKAAIPDAEDLLDFLICNNGAEIYDYVADRYHQQFPVSAEIAKEIIAENIELGANPVLYKGELMIAMFEDDYTRQVEKFLDLEFSDNIYQYIKETQPKIIFSVDEETEKKVMDYHKKKNDPRYSFFKSQKELVEFMDPRIDKEVGLEWFCDYHDISLTDVMAFGDNDNDYEMVKAAGVGVAMKNATASVKSVADHGAKSNDDQGVYKFLIDYLSD